MKKLALLTALTFFTGCAPFSGIAGISAVSTASCKSVEATRLSPEGEAYLIMELDSRYELKKTN